MSVVAAWPSATCDPRYCLLVPLDRRIASVLKQRHMTARSPLAFLLLIFPLGLVGCGNSAGTDTGDIVTPKIAKPDAPAKAVSACTLLTQEEAAALLGEPVEKPTDSATGGTVTNCNWMTPSFNMVGILVRLASSPAEAETVRQEARQQSKSLSGVDPEEVAGLGANAYWAGGNINQLNVFKGNYWLIITASKGNSSDNLSLAKAVAEKALPRLG